MQRKPSLTRGSTLLRCGCKDSLVQDTFSCSRSVVNLAIRQCPLEVCHTDLRYPCPGKVQRPELFQLPEIGQSGVRHPCRFEP